MRDVLLKETDHHVLCQTTCGSGCKKTSHKVGTGGPKKDWKKKQALVKDDG